MARAWLAVCAAGLALSPAGPRAGSPPREARAAGPSAGLPELTRLAESTLPAVVGILTTQAGREGPPLDDPLKNFSEYFRDDGPRKGLATGFVVHADGYIVTNAHVVEGASRIEVELGEDDERLPARVVGRDEASDVALLAVNAGRPLPTLTLGDSDQVRIAEWVMVVGNPFGLSHSVTVGVVSQTGRASVTPAGRDGYYDFIQTDASINPGNSGGPLVNLRGEVVGIATAVNATGQGIGFAVPINMAKDVVEQLRRTGRVVRSWMGVAVRELRAAAAAPEGNHRREVVVTEVVRGGPAAASGLRVGDVITGFEGQRVPSAARLRWRVATAGVGRSVALTVRRGSAERSLSVELAELPPDREGGAAPVPPGPAALAPIPPEE